MGVGVREHLDDPASDGSQACFHGTVLGEAHDADVKGLHEGLIPYEAKRLELHIKSKGEWSPRGARSFPPWLFEFRANHYGWESVGDIHRWQRVAEHFGDAVPCWLAAMVAASSGGVPVAAALSLRRKLLEEIAHFGETIGKANGTIGWFGRPHVFLFALLQVLARPERDTVVGLRDCLFVDRSEIGQVHPLGLDDPLRQVWHLLHNLEQMLEHNSDVLREARSFQLYGPAILRAKLDGTWRTLLAYCGNCGNAPLWYGSHGDGRAEVPAGCDWCPCGEHRLLCDACGKCGVNKKPCELALQAKRQWEATSPPFSVYEEAK